MANPDPKETWALKVNLGPLVNKEFQAHKGFLVLKAPLVLLVKKVHKENLDFLDLPDLMVPLVTLEKKVRLARKVPRGLQVRKVRSDILALVG